MITWDDLNIYNKPAEIKRRLIDIGKKAGYSEEFVLKNTWEQRLSGDDGVRFYIGDRHSSTRITAFTLKKNGIF